MLLGMLPESDPKHALLEKVRRQADRATDIVNNLLNFSRTGNAEEFNQLNIHRVDRKSTRLNSSHGYISYAVFCLKKKKDREKLIDMNTKKTTHRNDPYLTTDRSYGGLADST